MKIRRILWVSAILVCAAGAVALFYVLSSTAFAANEVSLMKNTALTNADIDRWQVLVNMNAGRGDPGVVAVNNKIHVINGFWSPGYYYVYSQFVYDPQTGSWQEVQYPLVSRSDFVTAYVYNKIYAIGGWNEDPSAGYNGVLDLNHAYDPLTDTWDDTLVPLPTPVSGAGGVF